MCLWATGGAQRQAEEGDGWGSEAARSLMDSVTEMVLESILGGPDLAVRGQRAAVVRGCCHPHSCHLRQEGSSLTFIREEGKGEGNQVAARGRGRWQPFMPVIISEAQTGHPGVTVPLTRGVSSAGPPCCSGSFTLYLSPSQLPVPSSGQASRHWLELPLMFNSLLLSLKTSS